MEVVYHRGHPTPADSFWNHYIEVPDTYDRWALASAEAAHVVHDMVDFRDKQILDVSSGTGKNAFVHALVARRVIGLEPKPAMLAYARDRARTLGVTTVEFREGIAEDLSAFANSSFDIAISMFGAPFPWDTEHRFLAECERVVRPGGHIIVVGTTPGWRMLHGPVRLPPERDGLGHLPTRGFAVRDVVVPLDYGTVSEALATWGFVFGAQAIDYIMDNNSARQEWGLRIYIKGIA